VEAAEVDAGGFEQGGLGGHGPVGHQDGDRTGLQHGHVRQQAADAQPRRHRPAVNRGEAGPERMGELGAFAGGMGGGEGARVGQHAEGRGGRAGRQQGAEQFRRIAETARGGVIGGIEHQGAALRGGLGQRLGRRGQGLAGTVVVPARQLQGQLGGRLAGGARIAVGPHQGGRAGPVVVAPGKAGKDAAIEQRDPVVGKLAAPQRGHHRPQLHGRHDGEDSGHRADRAEPPGQDALQQAERATGRGGAVVRPAQRAGAVQQQRHFVGDVGQAVEAGHDGQAPRRHAQAPQHREVGPGIALGLAGAVQRQVQGIEAPRPQRRLDVGEPGAEHLGGQRPARRGGGAAQHPRLPIRMDREEGGESIEFGARRAGLAERRRSLGPIVVVQIRQPGAARIEAVGTAPEACDRQTDHETFR